MSPPDQCARREPTRGRLPCALSAKCLIVERMWRLCTPAIMLPAIIPVNSGSSEKILELRPPRGSRMRFAVPPRSTLKPLARASAPTAGLECTPALDPRSRRGRGWMASRSLYRWDARRQDWRRQVLRRSTAARECRGEECRGRIRPTLLIRAVWAYRPMGLRSRHEPPTAFLPASSDRAPFGRAGTEAGRHSSTASLARRPSRYRPRLQ